MIQDGYIVIHHSATADSGTVSWDDIERYHVEEKGWADIGYHFGVELTDTGGYMALVGRDERQQAAACKEAGMNRLGVHICCVGDYDAVEPPEAMLRVLVRRLVLPLMSRWGVKPEKIIGHRDAGLLAGFDWTKGEYKSCPGKMYDLERVRSMVR